MTDTARMADIVLPTTTFAEKEGTYTNMTRHVQRVTPATRPQGQSKTDHDIFVDLAEAFGKPFVNTAVSEVQGEISRTVAGYKERFPGTNSKQWAPEGFTQKSSFHISRPCVEREKKSGYPFQLVSNNHMFHIGSYTHYAKALTDIGPDCIAELNPQDARELNIDDGDRIVIESDAHKLEVQAKANPVTAKGMVYVPKNWVSIPLNLLRNGEEGPVSIKISKVG